MAGAERYECNHSRDWGEARRAHETNDDPVLPEPVDSASKGEKKRTEKVLLATAEKHRGKRREEKRQESKAQRRKEKRQESKASAAV